MKIYFDFDRTLFDTDSFINSILDIIKKYHIPLDLFLKYKNEFKDNFNIYHILSLIKKDYPYNDELIREIDNLIYHDDIFLYSDVIPFLEKLKKNNYEIILLTKGNEEFQKIKINNSKIKDYFNRIIITLKHKGELNIDYNAIFIDDNIDELLSIKKNNPKKLIYINRNNKENNLPNEDIFIINSLEDIDMFL